jgi:hypothetical protein
MLSEADATAPPPIVGRDIAGQVRRRARRRNIGRVAGVVILAVGAGMILRSAESGTGSMPTVVAQSNNSSPQNAVTSISNEERFQNETAGLAEQAAFHERMVTELLAVERRDALERKLHTVLETMPASDQVAVEREAAAAIVVAGGDELLHSPGGKAAAGERYRSVIQLFPDTRIAPVALERLKQTSTQQNIG